MADSFEADAGAEEEPQPKVGRDFLRSLCLTYADLLRRQRSAASPFVRWSKVTNRSHEFAWVGPALSEETLILKGQGFDVGRDSEIFESVQKMHGTVKLNPYEREVVYGYPFVVGRRGGKAIRGPLLYIPVSLEPAGAGFAVTAAEDVVRFNSLPFRTNEHAPVQEQAVTRVIQATPQHPVEGSLSTFVDVVRREFTEVQADQPLDGQLRASTAEPSGDDFIAIIDQAALFVAPKGSYFLTSDLDYMAEGESIDAGSLASLIAGAGDEPSVDISTPAIDAAKIIYPFPANRSQRRVAMLVDDPGTSLVRVEGPPGTGKSLTIANLACHLAATGRKVLITSQKDKALAVVEEMLAGLGLPELPMTLLRHDRDSKKELLSRIGTIEKRRSAEEVTRSYEVATKDQEAALADYSRWRDEFRTSIGAEAELEAACRDWESAQGLRKALRRISRWRTSWRIRRRAPVASDELGDGAAARRERVRTAALQALKVGAELGVATASRVERQRLRELAAVLRRDQKAYKNFSIFDRLKSHPEWAEGLLKLLPVWILAPDDVARLFPAKPGLFDVVIVDEASQVDLPSIAPVLYRGKKAALFGDTKQMQPRRFAFMSQQVSLQAWKQFGLEEHDPNGWLDPLRQSLLTLGEIRAEEENLLDEHFRSLPPIIQFSNDQWYDGRLRIMTDVTRKKFGGPEQPVIELHHVEDGEISNGSQENEREAEAVVAFLREMLSNPDYAGASIGVICLFEEQVALVQDMVADSIESRAWEEHNLVVVNPDGFQGDERDLILYSLSFDNKNMPRAALSARQQDSPHVQGMLNVGFTRGRDELHVFHSAPIADFTMADGSDGALTAWLRHCEEAQRLPRAGQRGSRLGQVDSQFEADVAAGLHDQGVRVLHQYPACGFSIDLVCEMDGRRVGVECDGWLHHTDAQGELPMEDLERQAVLERAGWRIVRIPYRRWLADPDGQVARVLRALREDDSDAHDPDLEDEESPAEAGNRRSIHKVTKEEEAIIRALRGGARAEDDVLRAARGNAGYRRLGKHLKQIFLTCATELNHRGLVVIEDGEYFLTPEGRAAELEVIPGGLLHDYEARKQQKGRGRRKRRSRAAAGPRCSCGGRWVRRTGRYGTFYGCSRYPRCRRTKSA